MASKIIYISGAIIPSSSANSVHVMKWCQALKKKGHQVCLLSYTEKVSVEEERVFDAYEISNKFSWVRFKISHRRFKFLFSIIPLMAFLLRQKRDTFVYGRDLLGILLSSLMGFKVYYESHGIPLSFYHKCAERFLLKRKNLQSLIVISGRLKEMYVNKNFGIAPENIKVLHDGADPIDRSKERKNFGAGLHIGYVGSLYQHGRGIDIILQVAMQNPNLVFHLVGGKANEIKDWRKVASDNVVFHGYKTNKTVIRLLLGFDIVLMPYQENIMLDGMNYSPAAWMSPMKMFEYMSAGKAIISSDLPVIREVLNESNSILVKSDDSNEWTLAVQKLCEDKELRDRLGQRARSDFYAKYTWDKRVEFLEIE